MCTRVVFCVIKRLERCPLIRGVYTYYAFVLCSMHFTHCTLCTFQNLRCTHFHPFALRGMHCCITQVQLVLMPLSECGQLLGLLERVEMLTSSMNDSLSALHSSSSLSNLQLVVERLSSSVLPHTRLSLVRHQLAMFRHLASEVSLLSFQNPKSV